MKKTNPNKQMNKDQFRYDRKKIRKVYKKRIYYILLSMFLLICLIQTTRGAYLNLLKYYTLKDKASKLDTLNSTAIKRNDELKQQLKTYTSYKGIEELARDNLNMVGKDEVLVVIRKNPDNTEKK